MCTFDLSLNNALVDSIRPAFRDETAIKEWMQQQLEILMVQFKAKQIDRPSVNCQHSLSHLRGIGSTGKTLDQLRDEYYEEKYGL